MIDMPWPSIPLILHQIRIGVNLPLRKRKAQVSIIVWQAFHLFPPPHQVMEIIAFEGQLHPPLQNDRLDQGRFIYKIFSFIKKQR